MQWTVHYQTLRSSEWPGVPAVTNLCTTPSHSLPLENVASSPLTAACCSPRGGHTHGSLQEHTAWQRGARRRHMGPFTLHTTFRPPVRVGLRHRAPCPWDDPRVSAQPTTYRPRYHSASSRYRPQQRQVQQALLLADSGRVPPRSPVNSPAVSVKRQSPAGAGTVGRGSSRVGVSAAWAGLGFRWSSCSSFSLSWE